MARARTSSLSLSRRQSRLAAAVAVGLTVAGATAGAADAARPAGSARPAAHVTTEADALPLGPTGLPETRTTTTIEPGVTLTHIVRGAYDALTPWVVELSIPATSSSPDPDAPARSVQDRASADELVRRLGTAGFDAQSQPVTQPAVADVPAGVIGYRVRATSTFASSADAGAYVARLKTAGFTAHSWYAGWDGESMAKGQWSINVLTIDPRHFHGRLGATFGPDIVNRETTSALSAYAHAKAAVNGGFFVLDPKSGAPGDPAGVGVYDGALESETVA